MISSKLPHALPLIGILVYSCFLEGGSISSGDRLPKAFSAVLSFFNAVPDLHFVFFSLIPPLSFTKACQRCWSWTGYPRSHTIVLFPAGLQAHACHARLLPTITQPHLLLRHVKLNRFMCSASTTGLSSHQKV